MPTPLRLRGETFVPAVNQNDDRVNCRSCNFPYPRVRGFCPICGAALHADDSSEESEPAGGKAGSRTPEIHLVRDSARRRSLDTIVGKSVFLVLAAVLLVCAAFLLTTRRSHPVVVSPPQNEQPVATPPAILPPPTPPAAEPSETSAPAVEKENNASGKTKPLTARPSSQDPAALWKAVRKGDAEAEVTLGQLYLDGNGVNQSCDQAHLLLLAASHKHNHAAEQILTSTYPSRCP